MAKYPVLFYIKKLRRPVFTTHELSSLSGKSASATTQALNLLVRQGLVLKIYRGIWAEADREDLSPCAVVPFLFPGHRAYVSFLSALNLHGIIEQIPQVITLASTVHTKRFQTKIGTFSVHRLAPSFFDGFVWSKGQGGFLIAEPEKALVDCLYLSACRKKQFSYFPELNFPPSFSFKRARSWAGRIRDLKISAHVKRRLDEIAKARQ